MGAAALLSVTKASNPKKPEKNDLNLGVGRRPKRSNSDSIKPTAELLKPGVEITFGDPDIIDRIVTELDNLPPDKQKNENTYPHWYSILTQSSGRTLTDLRIEENNDDLEERYAYDGLLERVNKLEKSNRQTLKIGSSGLPIVPGDPSSTSEAQTASPRPRSDSQGSVTPYVRTIQEVLRKALLHN